MDLNSLSKVSDSAYSEANSKRNASKKKGTYMTFKVLSGKTSPKLAAYLGRKKYGKKGFAALSAHGKKVKDDSDESKFIKTWDEWSPKKRINFLKEAFASGKRAVSGLSLDDLASNNFEALPSELQDSLVSYWKFEFIP
jgi:CRISPR/Cas system CSM-associated protein Csm2 small subunit